MSLHFPNSWLEILVVAGDPERLRLDREALRTERGSVHLARDAAEAGALLRGEGELVEPIRPNVVVLDLSLPEPEWPAIAGSIVAAGLTGPVMAIEWRDDGVRAADGAGSGDRQRERHADLSRLIRQAILEKRREDERTASLVNEPASDQDGGAMEWEPAFGSGGADGPGCHAGVGEIWIYLTLREGTEAGILDGLAALRDLAAGLARRPAGDLPAISGAKEEVLPEDPIREIVERYRPLADARGLQLLEIYDDEAPPILADGKALVAALGVLTAYVLSFARPGQDVSVSSHVDLRDAVSFSLYLRGAGIAEDQLPLVADVFAVVAPIVEAHGARLRFGSSWGKFCSFNFRLPEPPPARD